MKKALKWILFIILAAAFVVALVYFVFKFTSQYDTETTGNAGLSYTLSSDGTYYICDGIGSCSDKNITIADSYDNTPVKEIGENAFQDCVSIKSVVIPDSVTSIGSRAFKNCTSLISVTIGKGVTEIEQSTFWGCSALESVVIPDSVTSIGQSGFSGCTSLKSVTIPDSVTYIYYAFNSCDNLTEVTFEKTDGWLVSKNEDGSSGSKLYANSVAKPATAAKYLTSTYKTYYWYNTELLAEEEDQDTGSAGLTYALSWNSEYYIVSGIGWCTDKELVIPETYNGLPVTMIADSAFEGNTTITSVVICDSVEIIGKYAFNGCVSLKTLVVGDSVTEIEEYAFRGCTTLTSVTLGNSVTVIGTDAFSRCTRLEEITIPASVVIIHNRIFAACSKLTSVIFLNTEGWYVTETENASSGEDLDPSLLADTSIAATYLTDYDSYVDYYWYNTNS